MFGACRRGIWHYPHQGRLCNQGKQLCQGRQIRTNFRRLHSNSLHICEEVKAALFSNKPVVALETTIITHGMPHPHNLRTALGVEKIIRDAGAIPAAIGILQGQIHIGLTEKQLQYLADPDTKAVKTSRRDLSYVTSQGLNGGTTVSGTMVLAHLAGIPVFVTGGIGGVHRGAESSMDISADLTELGRTPVTVVSAGVKSILDIGRTLEYLETQGVCVATYGQTQEFPAFFSRKSGYLSPYNVTTAEQAARLIDSQEKLGLQTGTLIAVPIPEKHDTLGQEIETVIQSVVIEAQENGIQGKEVTPYILKRVNEETHGKSLETNIHLIENNATIGSQIAVELAKLRGNNSAARRHKGDNSTVGGHKGPNKGGNSVRHYTTSSHLNSKDGTPRKNKSNKQVTVVGGSIVDFTARMNKGDFKMNGATYIGSVSQSYGGVGRNIADGLSRLDVDTLFISAIGQDSHTHAFESHCQHMDLSRVARLEDHRTATYCAVLRPSGELLFGIGDMDINAEITPKYISQFEEDLISSGVVCIDGNITLEATEYVCDVCANNNVPVFFEPTDLHRATRPLQTSAHKGLVYASPNFNELTMIAAYIEGKENPVTVSIDDLDLESALTECCRLLKPVSTYIPVTMVTLGRHGVVVCRRESMTEKLPVSGVPMQCDGAVICEYFPARPPEQPQQDIVSVSGAGDCMVAAFLSRIIRGDDPHTCVRAGLLAAQSSLPYSQAVPSTLSQDISDDRIRSHMMVEPRRLNL